MPLICCLDVGERTGLGNGVEEFNVALYERQGLCKSGCLDGISDVIPFRF